MPLATFFADVILRRFSLRFSFAAISPICHIISATSFFMLFIRCVAIAITGSNGGITKCGMGTGN